MNDPQDANDGAPGSPCPGPPTCGCGLPHRTYEFGTLPPVQPSDAPPTYVLSAADPFAAGLLRRLASLEAQACRLSDHTDALHDVADAMEAWRARHGLS